MDLRLSRDNEGFWLELTDDGQGFDSVGAFPGHLGLRSMRERAEHLGGNMEIASTPGEGTRIRVRIPVLVLASIEAAGPQPDDPSLVIP